MSRNEPPMDPELGLGIDTGSKAKNQYVVLSRFQKLMKSKNTAMVLTTGVLLGAVTVGGIFYLYGSYEEDSRQLAILGSECKVRSDNVHGNCIGDDLYCVYPPAKYMIGTKTCLYSCSAFNTTTLNAINTKANNQKNKEEDKTQLKENYCACGPLPTNPEWVPCTKELCESAGCKEDLSIWDNDK